MSATESPYKSLPRGRHAAPKEVVAADQRLRLLEATAHIVAEKGFAKTVVADIVARAGVSRKTFYEQFSDTRECLIASYEVAAEFLMTQIAESIDAGGSLESQMRAGATQYLTGLADHPHFARTFLIEAMGAGDELLKRRSAVHQQFAMMLMALHQLLDPEGAKRTPELSYRACVGAVNELVTAALVEDGTTSLPDLVDDVVSIQKTILGMPQ